MEEEQRIIKLLKVMASNDFELACSYNRNGYTAQYDSYMSRCTAIRSIINLLTDEEYLQEIEHIYRKWL